MPEKCALSHGSGVLGRDPRDSCRFWSSHVEKVCTVPQIRLGEGGGGDTIAGGGGVGEPRTGIIFLCMYVCVCVYIYSIYSIYIYTYTYVYIVLVKLPLASPGQSCWQMSGVHPLGPVWSTPYPNMNTLTPLKNRNSKMLRPNPNTLQV